MVVFFIWVHTSQNHLTCIFLIFKQRENKDILLPRRNNFLRKQSCYFTETIPETGVNIFFTKRLRPRPDFCSHASQFTPDINSRGNNCVFKITLSWLTSKENRRKDAYYNHKSFFRQERFEFNLVLDVWYGCYQKSFFQVGIMFYDIAFSRWS